jgi:hypothetical protein
MTGSKPFVNNVGIDTLPPEDARDAPISTLIAKIEVLPLPPPPSGNVDFGLTESSPSTHGNRKRRQHISSTDHLEKKPKVEQAPDNGPLQEAKLKLKRLAAQRNLVEAERMMRLAQLEVRSLSAIKVS